PALAVHQPLSMSFHVAEECRALGLRAGAIVFRNVRVAAAGADLRTAIVRECGHIREQYAGQAAVRAAPEVVAFQALLRQGGATPTPVVHGEYGYVDGAGRVLCRLDVLQADFSKVTTATMNALLIVEGTAAHLPDVLRTACTEVMEQVLRHCGGTAEVLAFP